MREFPRDMDAKTQGLVMALSFKFAKRRPGLEQDDLINEALVKFQQVKQFYDPDNPSNASFTTVFYSALKNHYLNMQTHFTNALIALDEETYEEVPAVDVEIISDVIEKHFRLLRETLTEPISRMVFEKLIEETSHKKTVKQICQELDISFFRYQQAEYKIKHAIKKITN